MRIGQKSLLLGVHQFLYHPWKVFWAWVWLFGWPTWGEIVAIIIHDWGYWWCRDMDGEQGSEHPMWACHWLDRHGRPDLGGLCLRHSRFLAKRGGARPSRLCYADKLATANYPLWLWTLMAWATGEGKEYAQGVGKHELKGDASFIGLYRFIRRYRPFALKIVGEDLCKIERSA